MNWDDIRLFLAVARAESLTGAGKALRLDPATLGRRIARLEETLGTALFVRSPRGYGLSEAGERLMARAIHAEQALQEGAEELREQEGQLTGSVRVGAPDGVANFLLPQVTAALCDANPGLEVQIVAQPRVFNLSRREADMAIAVSPPKTGRLTVQKITDYHLHLAATRSYLQQHPPIRELADVAGHRIVGYIPDLIFDSELDYLSEVGAARVTLASNSVVVQLNWLRTGAGLGIVHDFAMPFAPGLVKVLPDRLALRRSFYLVRHGDDRRNARLSRFAGLLAEGVRAELARLEAL
ncbi:LysR family transcriptional regulator [Rhodovulum adriaticum]|uniref:LysR family transcriptional regulator n=1 Tax=Rhodovulum adriaticum TaxID=35804 RepID=A0A4R2NP49_RHOAD|nr:LysR family transcriptional regulator [Rhodovulum adriaticum]MBK1634522.1 LysR family transcriptional regulator [Rhodovulum adriaticum]TCP23108.1 LysR family transcriptional regulator [Rhodovulum adriaticum]